MEETVSISDACKETDFSERQLRSFESRGYITPPVRITCGEVRYRRFSKENIKEIKIFKNFVDQGYKLAFASQKAFDELAKEVKE